MVFGLRLARNASGFRNDRWTRSVHNLLAK
jgi:hypothetical protein